MVLSVTALAPIAVLLPGALIVTGMSELAQGAMDLHSGRSQVDFEMLADLLPDQRAAVLAANTANEVLGLGGPGLAAAIAGMARQRAQQLVGEDVRVDVLVVDRNGVIVGESG